MLVHNIFSLPDFISLHSKKTVQDFSAVALNKNCFPYFSMLVWQLFNTCCTLSFGEVM